MRTFVSDLTDLDDLGVSVVQGKLTRFKEVPGGVKLMAGHLFLMLLYTGQNQ